MELEMMKLWGYGVMKRQVGRVSEGENVRACRNILSCRRDLILVAMVTSVITVKSLIRKCVGGPPLSGAGGSGG